MGSLHLSFCVFSLMILNSNIVGAYEEDHTKVHIIYLGAKQHNDPEVVTASHFKMLEALLGSKKDSRESMIHSYRHGFSGFAAYLTDSQAATISEHPDVVEVSLNRYYQVQTTRTYDYLGLSRTFPQHGLLLDANMGEDMIIGVFDSGVWPESQSFNDIGLGPIPTRWKGKCVDGEKFDSMKHCNRKLIGARYYVESLFFFKNKTDSGISGEEYMSARESYPHGTHVASTAGGSYVSNVSFNGFGLGTVRGGDPRARIAMYKICWQKVAGDTCGVADLLKAMDDAIEDGVDVMSLSLGSSIPIQTETDLLNDFSYGAFHAMLKGIPVICAGGNGGPEAYTVDNISPWIITVAATTLDRWFPTPLTLGNNVTLAGRTPYKGQDIHANLMFVATANEITSAANGTVLFAFATHGADEIQYLIRKQITFGVKALIVSTKTDDGNFDYAESDRDPLILIDYEQGTVMKKYIDSTSMATIKIGEYITFVGPLVATKVAQFSSRGPNSVSPYVLKPDIAAPGVTILAATTPLELAAEDGFAFKSGTSMSTPVVASSVALLRAVHRDWSPAAIRSALVTTASTTDPHGEPIFAGLSQKLADPFDFGGGLMNPNKAADPGLVYDAGVEDYLGFLCASGYNEASISKIANKTYQCPTPKPSMLDLNLPSITVPFLKEDVTVTRTVTNVGPVNSIYKLVVVPPRGVRINVTPSILVFTSIIKQISFEVKISATHRANSIYYFGSLTWTDCDRNVTIPLSVRTEMVMYFNY